MVIRSRDFIIFAIFFVFMLVEPVCAFNLGTLQKTASHNVTSGDTVQFDILFWNADDSGYSLELENVDVPKDWVVISDPAVFHLDDNYSGKAEHMYIPRLKRTVSAPLVNVYVSVPKSAQSGKYTIALKAVAGAGDTVSGFSLRQERMFFFDVYVAKDLYPEAHNDEIGPKTVSIDISPIINHQIKDVRSTESEREMNVFQHMRIVILLLIVIVVLVVARRIYEYD